jgi:hypothetical protein
MDAAGEKEAILPAEWKIPKKIDFIYFSQHKKTF